MQGINPRWAIPKNNWDIYQPKRWLVTVSQVGLLCPVLGGRCLDEKATVLKAYHLDALPNWLYFHHPHWFMVWLPCSWVKSNQKLMAETIQQFQWAVAPLSQTLPFLSFRSYQPPSPPLQTGLSQNREVSIYGQFDIIFTRKMMINYGILRHTIWRNTHK